MRYFNIHRSKMLMESVARLLLLFSLLPTDDELKYAVVFDAGSSGSRVHVFSFDKDMSLLRIGQDYEFFLSIKPGLSSYEKDPRAAAESLRPLLEQAQAVVPQHLRSTTPLTLGATAGLRLLPGSAAEDILDAVRELFKSESSLNYKAELVSVLDGKDEGAYEWVAINYLLGKLGEEYSKTVAVVDLGGGSVQVAYSISDKAAASAPTDYVVNKFALATNYNLYTHSYLNYGILAARAQSLNLSDGRGNPCVTTGYRGTYEYSGQVYTVSAPASGSNLRDCIGHTKKLLRLDAACLYDNCSFDGVWNGGGGKGFHNLYVASSYYETAVQAGIVKEDANIAIVTSRAYLEAAKRACSATSVDNIKSRFPLIQEGDVPFLCMNLVYEYTLLVHAFGIDPTKNITLVKNIPYKDSFIGAAWPLGSAVELLSA